MSFDVQDEVTVDHLSTVVTRNYLIVGALGLLVWEYAVTVGDEFSFIWRKPFNYVKFLYILSRYYGLAAQSYLGPVSSLFHLIDFPLEQIVYALYKKDSNIGFMLLCLFVMDLGVDAGCAYAMYHKTPYDVTCDSYEMPFHSVYLTSPVIAMQTVIWTMTLYKTHSLGARQNIPLLRIIMRDGAWVFLLVVALYMSTIPYVAASRVMKTHAALILPISMLSISGCRLIMNTQRIAVEPEHTRSSSSDSVCLTSFIDVDDEIDEIE
ncbi:hypothetical protein BDQ17DRAFT_1412644 [Cyathus striatus]|nr:hypothetical protein BDQ17DRAFT_1412644 [Cyathus striatus]